MYDNSFWRVSCGIAAKTFFVMQFSPIFFKKEALSRFFVKKLLLYEKLQYIINWIRLKGKTFIGCKEVHYVQLKKKQQAK